MSTDNTIKVYDGSEIYSSRIYELVDEYTNTLPEERTLEESETFSGLISYLYYHLFRDTERKNYGCVLDYDDIQSFDRVWQIYTHLCGRYKQTASLFEFCSLTGLSPDTLTDWANGKLRGNDAERIRTVKRWKNQTVSALEKKAVNSNSVGAIFSLKAAHSWRESTPSTPEMDNMLPVHDSAEQIAERHRMTALPEKPDFES